MRNNFLKCILAALLCPNDSGNKIPVDYLICLTSIFIFLFIHYYLLNVLFMLHVKNKTGSKEVI